MSVNINHQTNRIGVGVAAPTTPLDVRTASNEEDAILIEQADGTDVGSLRINNGSFIVKGKNSTNPVQIQTHDGNEDIEVDPDGFIKFETGGSERMRLTDNGLTFNGDTAAANALDDYEEGTFTATCDNSVTLHSTQDLCSYTKIGRLVTVQGEVKVNSDGGGGAMVINNLPFTRASASESEQFVAGSIRLRNVNCAGSGIGMNCRVTQTSKIVFEQTIDNADKQSINAGNNGEYGFTLTYLAS